MNPPSLITRCAHCHTLFRVTAEQLRARAGQVRCGRCLQVFDALAGLRAEPWPAAAAKGASPESFAPAADDPPPEAKPHSSAAAARIAPPEPAAAGHDITRAPQSADRGNSGGTQPDGAGLRDNPFIAPAPAAAPEPRRRTYALASTLLLLLLAGQAVYSHRGEIAARHALAREWIIAACAVAGCTVEMPQRPRQVIIEGSDLQLIDPARPERIRLTATLRNRAPHAVGFPALDLVLTTANDHTLARRIFPPSDYLPATVDRSAGLAAQAEMTVRLELDAGDLGAFGYRLELLAAAP